MAVHVTCPQCKQQIPFGRLFCTYCGAKLELTPDKVSSRTTAGEAFESLKKWVSRLVSLIVVAAAIGVFFWPVPPQGEIGSTAQAVSCEQRISTVRTRLLNGIIFSDGFSEAEVNAELKARLAKLANPDAGAGFVLKEVNIAFRPKKAIVFTRLSLAGKADITYEIEGEPVTSPRGYQFNVASVRIGHVPMPSFLNEFLSDRALNVFSEMRAERDLLSKIKKIDVEQGRFLISSLTR